MSVVLLFCIATVYQIHALILQRERAECETDDCPWCFREAARRIGAAVVFGCLAAASAVVIPW